MKNRNFKQLANLITVTRILGVVAIFWITPYKNNSWQLVAILLYTIVSSTDFLDGWVARKLNIVSDTGKVLDPLADKILVLVFLPLLEMQIITSFPVFIILTREFAIMALRVVSAKEGTIIAASLSGKIKTAITLPVCGILLARVDVSTYEPVPVYLEPLNVLVLWIQVWPKWFITMLIWTTVAVTIWSFFDYFGSFIWERFVKRAGGDEEKARRLIRSIIPNFFSASNLGAGIGATIFAVMGNIPIAVLLILMGNLFDSFDGLLARKLNASSKFGESLDSIADITTFGVAPSFIVFAIFNHLTSIPILSILGGALFFASVYYRLKRFSEGGHSNYFVGLPSPIGATWISIAGVSEIFSDIRIFTFLYFLTMYLMISKIPYVHLNHSGKYRFMRYMKAPTFIVYWLTLFQLYKFDLHSQWNSVEILFVCTAVYIISPFVIKVFNLKDNYSR